MMGEGGFISMKSRIIYAAAIAAALTGGCGKPIGAPAPTMPGSNATAPGGQGTQVTVTMKEWSIGVSPAAVPAGNVTLNIRDEGKEPHGLYVEGPGVERKASRTEPGATGTLTVAFPAGEFNITDFVKDNETAHNMKATLTVK
jgi:iron uptake system EfeUOB component EfeO/EfeM